MKKPTEILIFEDNEGMREGLMWLVQNEPELKLSGAYADAKNILNIIKEYTPDIVLMDIQMPGLTGIEALKFIKDEKPETQVIILTSFESEDDIFKAIRCGASGYLLKTDVSKNLITSINEVLDGGSPMSARVARKVMHYFAELTQPISNDYKLTHREKEILLFLIDGDSAKAIAKKNFISELTVKNHIRNIYEKLEVHCRAEAVTKAFREKLL